MNFPPMKRPLLLLAMLSAALLAHAQDLAAQRTAEKARLGAERARIEAAFAVQDKACYQKFAVTDCQNAARASRREALSGLRKQELVINEAERRERGASREAEIG